jgi:3-isopropylmalate/(R)-2-methylmalate dehydratase large subunit
MAVEAGAKAGLVEPDSRTVEYLADHLPGLEIEGIRADDDARYDKVLSYDISQLGPKLAGPSTVDNVRDLSDCIGLEVHQAYLGSCTNGRLEDLEIASRIVQGRKAHPGVRFLVVPASRKVFQDAVRLGYIETLVAAGAIVSHPACSLCCGRTGGILEDGERVVSTTNRSFRGRMGGSEVEILLASPATVAASALEGRIADCRAYL